VENSTALEMSRKMLIITLNLPTKLRATDESVLDVVCKILLKKLKGMKTKKYWLKNTRERSTYTRVGRNHVHTISELKLQVRVLV